MMVPISFLVSFHLYLWFCRVDHIKASQKDVLYTEMLAASKN